MALCSPSTLQLRDIRGGDVCCEAGVLLMSYTWRDTRLMAYVNFPPTLFQLMKAAPGRAQVLAQVSFLCAPQDGLKKLSTAGNGVGNGAGTADVGLSNRTGYTVAGAPPTGTTTTV